MTFNLTDGFFANIERPFTSGHWVVLTDDLLPCTGTWKCRMQLSAGKGIAFSKELCGIEDTNHHCHACLLAFLQQCSQPWRHEVDRVGYLVFCRQTTQSHSDILLSFSTTSAATWFMVPHHSLNVSPQAISLVFWFSRRSKSLHTIGWDSNHNFHKVF